MRLTTAQIARIKQLENRRGQITAQRVVADARSKKSPLHALFNWNERHAAEHWWLHRARIIIGAVTLQVTHHEAVLKAPCYIVDTTIKGGGYRAVVKLRDDQTSARESLIYTLETAAGHLRRAYDLAGPLGLTTELDDLLARIAGVARIVRAKQAA